MKRNNRLTYYMTYSAIIAAIYIVLTMVFAPYSFGPIQFRISEALTILPFFTPAAVPGLFIGCLLSNLLCGSAALDVIFGSLATLLGAMGSYALRKHKFFVCIPPIIANALIVPWVLRYAYGSTDLVPFMMLTVGIGEVVTVAGLGNMLLLTLERYRGHIFRLGYNNNN